MTTPNRSITGLTPRRVRADASRLIAANRTPPNLDEAPVSEDVSAPSSPTAGLPVESRPPVTGEKVKVSVYLEAALRDAARAVYRATSHLEEDESWSDMIGKAVAAEVERRQKVHNGGQPYEGGRGRLTPGRSVSD